MVSAPTLVLDMIGKAHCDHVGQRYDVRPHLVVGVPCRVLLVQVGRGHVGWLGGSDAVQHVDGNEGPPRQPILSRSTKKRGENLTQNLKQNVKQNRVIFFSRCTPPPAPPDIFVVRTFHYSMRQGEGDPAVLLRTKFINCFLGHKPCRVTQRGHRWRRRH